MALTHEQRAAHDGVVAALDDGNACLTGGPGVGKTFTTRAIVETLQRQGKHVGAAASTNKAAAVLSEALGDDNIQATTIHKLCGLRVDENHGTTKLTQTGESQLPQFDVVLIDETSMLDDTLLDIVEAQTACGQSDEFDEIFGEGVDAPASTRILYIGDKNQLNPVNQPFIARPFRTPDLARFELTKIMRQQAGSNIVDLLQPIRDHIEHGAVLTAGAFSSTELHDLRITSRDAMAAQLDRLAYDEDGDNLFIGWTNRVVDEANQAIRVLRFGARAVNSDFLAGETVMLRAPQVVSNFIAANTGECFTVTSAELCHETYLLGDHAECVRYWQIEVENHAPGFRVVDRASRAGWMTILNYKRSAALSANPTNRTAVWRDYYATRDSMADLQTRAAITSHRSQGSTYDRVVVDAADILRNPNTEEAARCLYVACSRPRSHLTLVF
jgi:exodeoxyribonuclease-5